MPKGSKEEEDHLESLGGEEQQTIQDVVRNVCGSDRSFCEAVVEEEEQKVTGLVQVPEFSGCRAATVAGLEG